MKYKRDVALLFLSKLSELAKLTQSGSGSHTDMLRAAGILRHLLLQSPLVTAANRQHHEKILYSVSDCSACPPAPVLEGMLWSASSILPEQRPLCAKQSDLKLDSFLAHPVMKVQNSVISVKQIVDQLANSAGAVHFDEEADIEEAAHELMVNSVWQLFGKAYTNPPIVEIAIVTLRAVEGLRRKLAPMPPGLPLIAHYRHDWPGAISFEPEHYLTADNMNVSTEHGIGGVAAMTIDTSTDGVICEIGNAASNDILSLSVVDQCLVLTYSTAVAEASCRSAPMAAVFDSGSWQIIGFDYARDKGLRIWNGFGVLAEGAADIEPAANHFNRLVIGADILGKNGARFAIGQLVVTGRPPSEEERRQLCVRLASDHCLL
jgi:hypothetical protein